MTLCCGSNDWYLELQLSAKLSTLSGSVLHAKLSLPRAVRLVVHWHAGSSMMNYKLLGIRRSKAGLRSNCSNAAGHKYKACGSVHFTICQRQSYFNRERQDADDDAAD